MVVFKSIKPATQFKSSIFRETLRAQALKIEPQIQKDFEKTVRTWSDKPEFKGEVRVGNAAGGALARKTTGSASGIVIEVSTESQIYNYVDAGTKVRYATMTPDFQAKTKPNKIASYRGRGGLLFVNRKRPRPGIKARNFTKLIHKKWQNEFRAQMQSALNKAAKNCGHPVP